MNGHQHKAEQVISKQENKPTSEFRIFIRKFALRLFVFGILLLLVFALRLPKAYYYDLPKKTIHSKLSWIKEKLDATQTLDNTVVFVGSSVCFFGINDSLLNARDTTGTQYLNLGVVHHNNDIADVILRDILISRKLKPAKVLLCVKSDALARDVHHMYPLVAGRDEILSGISAGNTQLIPTILKRVSWNTHYFTGHVKFDEGEDSLIFNSSYGYKAQDIIDSLVVESSYRAQKAGMESVFSFIEQSTAGGNKGIKQQLLGIKRNYIDNEKFQLEEFRRSASLLEAHGIDYDIIIYPNLVASRAGKEGVMAAYMQKLIPEIDYTQHRILIPTGDIFKDARSYVDMNHLSPMGADGFSEWVVGQ